MIKRDVIENPESCLNRAFDLEQLFIFMARDPAAPVAIRAWARERVRLECNAAGDEQIREAYECAALMELQRSEIVSSRRQQQLPLTVGPVETAPVEQESCLFADDPLVDVLHRALGNRTGKLRIADAYLICGIDPGKVNQDQISRFGRAIRELGWECQRCRLDGFSQYVYVRGTDAEREMQLVVEYDASMRTARIVGVAP